MNVYILILSIYIFNISINCIRPEINSNSILDWGIKNNLILSQYLELSSISDKNKIHFIAKTDIPKKVELLNIPNSLMFNITKILNLINSKNLNKQYKEFFKLNLTYDPNPYDFRKEEAFLSYIFYLIEHKSKKYKKTKFYEIYQNYYTILKTYNFKSPIFYDQNQVEWLAGTHLSNSYDVMKKVYQTEIDIFSNELYYKKELDFDEYAKNRLIIYNKGLNVSNHWTLIPFLNFFEYEYSKSNANYSIEKNGDIKIYSRKNIKKGEEIILKALKISNIRRLLLEGKTNEKLVNYFDEYLISAFSPGLYYSYGINDVEYFRKYSINLKDKDFDSKANNIYFENAEILGGDGSDNWAYNVLESNLYYYKEHFEKITLSQIYDIFYDTDDRINIERIFRGERKVIDEAYDKVNDILDQIIEIQDKYMKKGKKGKAKDKDNKIIDL